jgi:hypothetical protein
MPGRDGLGGSKSIGVTGDDAGERSLIARCEGSSRAVGEGEPKSRIALYSSTVFSRGRAVRLRRRRTLRSSPEETRRRREIGDDRVASGSRLFSQGIDDCRSGEGRRGPRKTYDSTEAASKPRRTVG